MPAISRNCNSNCVSHIEVPHEQDTVIAQRTRGEGKGEGRKEGKRTPHDAVAFPGVFEHGGHGDLFTAARARVSLADQGPTWVRIYILEHSYDCIPTLMSK